MIWGLFYGFILARPNSALSTKDALLTKSNRWALFWYATFISMVGLLFIIDLWNQDYVVLGFIFLLLTLPVNTLLLAKYYIFLAFDDTEPPNGSNSPKEVNDDPKS